MKTATAKKKQSKKQVKKQVTQAKVKLPRWQSSATVKDFIGRQALGCVPDNGMTEGTIVSIDPQDMTAILDHGAEEVSYPLNEVFVQFPLEISSFAGKDRHSEQPSIHPGMRVVAAVINGSGPHYGTVMEVAHWGVLIRTEAADKEYGGRPVVVPIEDVQIIPAQAMSK